MRRYSAIIPGWSAFDQEDHPAGPGMKQRHIGVMLPSRQPKDGHHQTIAMPLRFGWCTNDDDVRFCMTHPCLLCDGEQSSAYDQVHLRGSQAPDERSLSQQYKPDRHYGNRRDFREPRLPWEPLQPYNKWQQYANDKRLPCLDAEVETDEGRG